MKEEPLAKEDAKKTGHEKRRHTGRKVDEEQVGWFDRKIKVRVAALYKRYVVEFILRRKALSPSKNGRHILLRPSHEQHLIDERRGHAYVPNSIRSSRYTIWDFLPKQFFFQTTRLNNLYFIAIGIPQTIPGISTTGSYTTILPLLFFICLTVIKEGYDDYRRHRLDKVENNSLATVLRTRNRAATVSNVLESIIQKLAIALRRPWRSRHIAETATVEERETDHDVHYEWTQIKWRDIMVGDVLRLKRDEAVPADIALLFASGEHGLAYIETMALDGETNLKGKQAPHELLGCHNIAGVKACNAEFVSEDPNRNLYEFNGRVYVYDNGKTVPLTLNEVVYRGSILRNTERAVGMVLNTGEECKIRMNANHHPKAKKPRLERQSNQIVLTLIVYVVLLSVGCSMGYLIWHQNFEIHTWYLNNSYVDFRDIIIGFFIMFNNVIPLSLYVSLEIVKIGQMIMVHSDVGMYDEQSNTPMICNTNTILENLGQVNYVLSDKTGTLTENVMRFRKMSVAGVPWSHQSRAAEQECKSSRANIASQGEKEDTFLQEGQASAGADRYDEKGNSIITTRQVSDSSDSIPGHSRPELLNRSLSRLSGQEHANEEALSTVDLIEYIRMHPNSAFSQKARDFILGMALCHTALPEAGHDGKSDFQASSPDELALVRATRDLGYKLVSRSTQSVTLLTTDDSGAEAKQVYDILDVIEFTSKRKRMSIILRCPDGKIWLLCKGADSVIVPRLHLATLAARRSQEVRRSMQLERDAHRRSEQSETRISFGTRPCLTVAGKGSMDIRPEPRRTTLEVPKPSRQARVQIQSLDVQHGRSSVFDNLENVSTMDESEVFSRCFRHMDEFATEGLRTLLFAHKCISPAEYAAWKKLYGDATTSLTDRQEKIEAAGDVIEQGFDLLGASAIEDKLQKGVPETIDKLRRANIKIWMLTGDKRETAINIARSARICKPESELYILNAHEGNLEEQLRDISTDIGSHNHHSVALIDGQTLAAVEEDTLLAHLFYTLIPLPDSVICCRASPAQKASIVRAIRARVPGALTLSIGDGSNDIAMIQASHVGVGISGKEGLQAARVADYSIAQFRFLQRLLLVHGRWNYVRTARFILSTFFKEFFFYMMQALYQRSNGYTGTSLYENWSLTVLNTLFTSLCVIIPGIFEQDLKPETLLAVPELYVYGQKNRGLNLQDYLLWMMLAAAEGMIVWFVSWAAYGKFNNMSDNGLFAIGDLSFSLGIAWQNIKLLILETHCKTTIVGVSFTITFAGWWAWNGFMSRAYSNNLSPYDVKYGFTHTFGNDPNWWLTCIIVLTLLVTIEMIYKTVRRCLLVAGVWPPWKRGLWRHNDRKAEALDVGLWQEMEKDPSIRKRLGRLADNIADEGDDLEGNEVMLK